MTGTGGGLRATPHARRTPWTRLDALLLFLLALAVYRFASNGRFMVFNYHLHLAIAFLEGRLHVPNPPPWLTEFAYFEGRAYVYFDPFPSVLLLPLAAIWRERVDIALVSIALGAVNVGLTRLALGALGVGRATANWCSLLLGFGTVHLFAAQYGNTWLLAHLCTVAALTLAWLEAAGDADPFLLGLFCAVAATSRSPALLGAPVFLVLALRRHPRLRTAARFGLPMLATMALLGAYNHARFGEWANNGYPLAIQAMYQPEHGAFSLFNVPRNLYNYFVRLPGFQADPPYLTLTDYGISLVATTPALLLLLRRGGWSERVPDAALLGRLALAAAGAILFLYLTYFWDGWRQFGCRYTLDLTPFLVVALALRNDDRHGRRPWLLPAFVLASIAVNAWGAWWWRAHDW